MRAFTISVFGVMTLAACATGAKSSIHSDLRALGLSENRSTCIADHLDENLDKQDLSQLAEILSSVGDWSEFLSAARHGGNFRIAAASATASVACVDPNARRFAE